MKIENRTELKEYRIECQKKQSADCRVLVCGGTGCLASGSGKIYEKLKELTKDHTGVEVKIGEEIAHTKVMKSGCHGFCEMGPLVRIEPYNYLYIKVKLEDCEEIYNETILGWQTGRATSLQDGWSDLSVTGRDSVLRKADQTGTEELRTYRRRAYWGCTCSRCLCRNRKGTL